MNFFEKISCSENSRIISKLKEKHFFVSQRILDSWKPSKKKSDPKQNARFFLQRFWECVCALKSLMVSIYDVHRKATVLWPSIWSP